MTLFVAVISVFLSVIFGTIIGVLRNRKTGILRYFASIYVEIVRNIPNLLWIFIVYLVFRLTSLPSGIIAFTIFTTAAFAEIIRGGLNGVAKGQIEAATSQGLNPFQILIHITFPQAIRNVLPAMISQFVTVNKDTSMLYSVIALQELFGKTSIIVAKYGYTIQILSIYGFVALIYFSLNFTISSFSRKLSKKWKTNAR